MQQKYPPLPISVYSVSLKCSSHAGSSSVNKDLEISEHESTIFRLLLFRAGNNTSATTVCTIISAIKNYKT